jgi:hypothetical protein
MTKKTLFIASAALAFTGFLTACTQETSSDGEPPTISALTYTPEVVSVGELTSLSGSLHFEDADGDLLELHMEIGDGSGRSLVVTATPISGVAGLTAGTVTLSLMVTMPSAGPHVLRVWVRDAQGQDSNALEGTLDAR